MTLCGQRNHYEVTFNVLDRRWKVRRSRSGWGPVLSSHRTQQAAADRAKKWAQENDGVVSCRDRNGRVQWVYDAKSGSVS